MNPRELAQSWDRVVNIYNSAAEDPELMNDLLVDAAAFNLPYSQPGYPGDPLGWVSEQLNNLDSLKAALLFQELNNLDLRNLNQLDSYQVAAGVLRMFVEI